MRTVVLFLVLAAAAYAVARWARSDARPSAPVRPLPKAGPSLASPGARTPPPPPPPPSLVPRSRPAAPAPESPSTPEEDMQRDDQVLLEMMTEHRDAMLDLRQALDYQLSDVLASCGDRVAYTVCWLRFYVELDGQLMQAKLKSVSCRDPNDQRMPACIRKRLAAPRDAIGIPRETADELGPYAGPADLAIAFPAP